MACASPGWSPRNLSRPVRALGLEFPNPVGLAAGLDKDAAHIDALARLGFGFIEVGTVTPQAQPGNPKPRLFRLPQAQALINRFGFNNVGVDEFLANVRRTRWRGILGINIGKNATTPAERAVEDYETCLEKVYSAASYITITFPRPTPLAARAAGKGFGGASARPPRFAAPQKSRARQTRAARPEGGTDLDAEGIGAIAEAVKRHGIEAVIATNTSTSREGVEGLAHAAEAGGLSGAPILKKSTAVLRKLARSPPQRRSSAPAES